MYLRMNLQMFADDPQNDQPKEDGADQKPQESGQDQKSKAKEEVPTWAQNLQKSLDTLNANLSSLIGSGNKETKPQTIPMPKPQTIPVPKPPKTETTPQESKGSKSSEKTGLQKLWDFLK